MLDYAKTYYICQEAYSDCLRFWRREGEPEGRARELAKKEVAALTTNPFSPNGEELDPEAQADFVQGVHMDV